MQINSLRVKSGTLWRRIVQQTEHAIQCGALYTINTQQEFISQGNVRFVVRYVSNLARKEEERRLRAATELAGGQINPFLPHDKELFVANISDTHLALLNKFNVIEHHLLIVTHNFEHQEELLTQEDFDALWVCMAEFDGLGFYNGGVIAGASQTHKHLQMVPIPLAEEGPGIPMEPLLKSDVQDADLCSIPQLPFAHAFTRFDPALIKDQRSAAVITLDRYRAMLELVGLKPLHIGDKLRQSAPYNLLITPRWMLLVPRSQELFESISINALGFAGSLFVRNQQQVQLIRDYGPMTVLIHVTMT